MRPRGPAVALQVQGLGQTGRHYQDTWQQQQQFTIREFIPGEKYVELARLMFLLAYFLTLNVQVFDSPRYKTEQQQLSIAEACQGPSRSSRLLKTLPKFDSKTEMRPKHAKDQAAAVHYKRVYTR